MPDMSVIICAHNPRPDYLHRVLDALRYQTLPVDQWELLLVDNASKEPLRAAWNISWHPNARHISESVPGLAHARQCGIREMATDLLVFVDDDNILAPNYLAESLRISQEWPELGTWGSGIIEPEFEIPPPDYLKQLVPYVALRNADAAYWGNIPTCKWATPWGAGHCVRAVVARAYCDFSVKSPIRISGRTGKFLWAGEDLEIDYVACSTGQGMAVFPELKLTHLIPKERISESYLLRIYEGTLGSECLLAYKWWGIRPHNPLSILGILDFLVHSLFYRGLRRRMYFAQKRAVRKVLKLINEASANDVIGRGHRNGP
jgi:glycosyltransferase involved in cell wall biosynthesis